MHANQNSTKLFTNHGRYHKHREWFTIQRKNIQNSAFYMFTINSITKRRKLVYRRIDISIST